MGEGMRWEGAETGVRPIVQWCCICLLWWHHNLHSNHDWEILGAMAPPLPRYYGPCNVPSHNHVTQQCLYGSHSGHGQWYLRVNCQLELHSMHNILLDQINTYLARFDRIQSGILNPIVLTKMSLVFRLKYARKFNNGQSRSDIKYHFTATPQNFLPSHRNFII